MMAHILIVDDYPVTQRLLSHILQSEGHTVANALHGIQALELMEHESYDLLIVDLDMPEMDGITLLNHLRANPLYKALPIVMLTASGQDEDRVRAQEAGANDFLTKPTSSRQLIETITHLLN